METPGVTQFTESMKYYGIWTGGYEQPYAMYAPAIVPPPENSDTIESWEFFYEIAKRLGRQIVYHANSAGTGEHWEKPPIPLPQIGSASGRDTACQTVKYTVGAG